MWCLSLVYSLSVIVPCDHLLRVRLGRFIILIDVQTLSTLSRVCGGRGGRRRAVLRRLSTLPGSGARRPWCVVVVGDDPAPYARTPSVFLLATASSAAPITLRRLADKPTQAAERPPQRLAQG